ncbi:hypothetical protein O6H91_20G035700 [Diphasiastrum complanatum]|uniref:Uncharacterized protein n=1 Tax=Diphasiastrum complanatum TaxID=34168 RepID=A0ACC2APB2_DIPCM|nr:hypothetical protein O6H91_20G035700 [Diphasiastrum complanatum]
MAEGLGMMEVLATIIFGTAYVYWVLLQLPKGLIRFLALLPLLAVYALLPWRAATAHAKFLLSFFLVWMCAFKFLLICWDAGTATDSAAMESFPRFFVAINFPFGVPSSNGSALKGKGPSADGPISSKEVSQVARAVLLRSALKILLLLPFYRFYDFRDSFPVLVVYTMYAFHIYLGCSVLFEGLAALGSLMVGLRFLECYDRPYLAGSLSEFWGRRWNQLVCSVLRASVYEPVRHFTSKGPVKVPIMNERKQIQEEKMTERKQERFDVMPKILATLAVFLVSGLMHDVIFFYLSRRVSWHATAFFVLQGVATVLEAAIRIAWPGRPKLPKFLAVILTISFVFCSAVWLFFPALCSSEGDLRIIQEFNEAQAWILFKLKSFLNSRFL